MFVTLTVWAMLPAGSGAARDGIHVRVDIGVRYRLLRVGWFHREKRPGISPEVKV